MQYQIVDEAVMIGGKSCTDTMTFLFILQLTCCIVTGMLAIHLAIASLQVRWKIRRYEVSRWMLCASMLVFSIHYLFQMLHGLRAQGADVGAAFNILFYTPVAFTITLSIINMESTISNVRRYCMRSAVAYALIVIVFIIGYANTHSFHIGNLLYVMLGIFVISMVQFIYATNREIKLRQRRLLQDSGSDIVPYVRYSQLSVTLLDLTALILPVAILINPLLYVVGPLMLLTVVFFVHSFIALGYYITPRKQLLDVVESTDERTTEQHATDDVKSTPQTTVATLPDYRLEEISAAIQQWCEAGLYKDCDVTIYSLADRLGCKKDELTQYFNQSAHTNFRTWLSDIRFNEAIRMMRAYPNYSNDTISTECGFSSHTQIYRVFKQKTGMSPSQWREQEG